MKNRPSSENYSDERDKHEDENRSITDQTDSSDSNIEIHFPEKNHKSERENKTWCSYMERGFRESRSNNPEKMKNIDPL